MDFRFILLPILVLPLGFVTYVLAARAWQSQRQANAARHWPHTQGRIVLAEVRETAVRVRSSTSTGRYRMATRYAPRIVYEYEMAGLYYQGERLWMGPAVVSSESDEAAREVARYPLGSEVPVYYNPSNPAEATLHPRIGWGVRMLWLAALIGLVTALTIAWVILSSPPIN